jgi:hypothetical protein
VSEPEIEQLIGEVAQKHGLLLSRDDPVLVSVTLNEQILSHALGQLQGSLNTAKLEIGALSARQTEAAKTIAEQLITAAAGYIADEVRAAAADIGADTDPCPKRESGGDPARTSQASWLAAAIAISAACVSGALAIAGPAFLENKPALASCRLSKRYPVSPPSGSKHTPFSMKRMPAASKVRFIAAIVAAIGLPRLASNRTTVLMPTLALSARCFTVQSSAARAILH